MLHRGALGKVTLEPINVRPADKSIVADHPSDCRIDLRFDVLVLQLKIRERYRHACLWTELPKPPRWIAGVGSGLRDVLSDHRAGPDHHVIYNGNGHDGRVGAERHAATNSSLAPEITVAARRNSGRKRVVNEHDTVANKAIITYIDEFADEAVRLHSRTRANN